MIIEAILLILIIWNIILTYYLFETSYVKYGSLEDTLVKHMAGYTSDEMAQEAQDEMRKICEKRGWKSKEIK